MARTLIVCALLTASPLTGRAADPPPSPETVVRLQVQAMPAPKPALKYQLLPELSEQSPGNPVQGYLKCFMEQTHFFFDKESVANREKWETMPLKELPLKELRRYGGPALKMADEAARLDTPDWQILLKLQREPITLLLPEVQEMRRLAAALKVRFRAEVAERRFDDALVTAKTLFALARHLGEHPTFIGELVGIAVASVALGPLEEMLGQPGCPNLYWALSELPRPLIGLGKGVQTHRLLLTGEVPLLARTAPLTEAQVTELIEQTGKLLKLIEPRYLEPLGKAPPADKRPDLAPATPQGRLKALLAKRAKDEGYLSAARKRLAEAGLPEERVKRFPAVQVVLLDEKLQYEVLRDEVLKEVSLPFWRMNPPTDAELGKKEEGLLFGGLVPAVRGLRRGQARLEQRLALLRHVEALRLHAAAHGKWPARLADVKVPLPADPITGKPFAYEVKGRTAVLRGTPPPGHENVAGYTPRYELTLRE
jgi:hypothetical protein